MKSFCIHTRDLTEEQINLIVLLSVEAGANPYECTEGMNTNGIEFQDYLCCDYNYVGVDKDNNTYFEDSKRMYGCNVTEFRTFEDCVKWLRDTARGLEGREGVEDFPEMPFSIRNADKPEVRQWLKDHGCTWNSGDDIVTHDPLADIITVREGRRVFYGSSGEKQIKLNIGVTSFEYDKSELEKEIRELEDKLATLKARL